MRMDDRALVGPINLLLVFGLITAALGTVTTVWDGSILAQREEDHLVQVEAQLAQFAQSLDTVAKGSRIGATVSQRFDLGAETSGIFRNARMNGGLALERNILVNNLGHAGASVSGTAYTTRLVEKETEGEPLVTPPTARVLAGLDRNDTASLTEFNLRVTDVAHLAGNSEAQIAKGFRIVVLKANQCSTATCPELNIEPLGSCTATQCKNIIWAATFYNSENKAQDTVRMNVLKPSGGGPSPSWGWAANLGGTGWDPKNGQTINVLCDKNSYSGCPVPKENYPFSALDKDLQLWNALFSSKPNPTIHYYDVWFVNSNKIKGTFSVGNPNPAPPGDPGALPPAPILAGAVADLPLVMKIEPGEAPGRDFRLEHGAVLTQHGDRAIMASPPPFVVEKLPSGRVNVTLRFNALASGAPIGGAGPVELGATLTRQLRASGAATELNITLQSKACPTWTAWFTDHMLDAGLGTNEFSVSCTGPGNGVARIRIFGPDSTTRDVDVNMLWSEFRIEGYR